MKRESQMNTFTQALVLIISPSLEG